MQSRSSFPPFLLLCLWTYHILVLRLRARRRRRAPVMTHPMMKHYQRTGDESTRLFARRPTNPNGKETQESEYRWGFFLIFSLTNLSLQKNSFHKSTWSRHTEGCFPLWGYQGLGAWSWQARWVAWWSRYIAWRVRRPRWRTGWRAKARVRDYLLLLISSADLPWQLGAQLPSFKRTLPFDSELSKKNWWNWTRGTHWVLFEGAFYYISTSISFTKQKSPAPNRCKQCTQRWSQSHPGLLGQLVESKRTSAFSSACQWQTGQPGHLSWCHRPSPLSSGIRLGRSKVSPDNRSAQWFDGWLGLHKECAPSWGLVVMNNMIG